MIRAGLALVIALNAGGAAGVSAAPSSPSLPHEGSRSVWVVQHGWHARVAVARVDVDPSIWPESRDLVDVQYLEVGWGDAAFYRAENPGVGLALRAALGSGGSALHVVALPASPDRIFAGREVVEMRLSRPGFRALVRFVDGTFARDGRGRAPRLGPGLYGISAFYPARGHYHLLNTCNTWIADALRSAGVPITPAYAMTAGNLMWQARRVATPAP